MWIELCIWFTGPVFFLAIYVVRFHNPSVVILEHLYPVALLAGFALLFKLLLYRVLPSRVLAAALSSVCNVSILSLLIAYYYLVVTGLGSWGKVINKELITSYAGQARGLCEAIGWSYPLLLACLAAAWTLMACLYYRVARRFYWAPALGATRRGEHLKTLFFLSASLLSLHRLDAYLADRHGASSEPFALTLYSGRESSQDKDASVVHYAAFDRDESDARQNYNPAAGAHRRNVILIVADALRADHMQAYGYARPTTPFFHQSIRRNQMEKIDNVHSPCSESNCAMASLLSAREPNRYPSVAFTLSQVLQLHGYSTQMILGGDQTNYYNKRAIYGKVDNYFDGSMAVGYYANDDTFVLDKTKQLPIWRGQPTMIQFHMMSVHLLGKKMLAYKIFKPASSFVPRTRGSPQPEFTNQYDNGVVQFDDFVRQILDVLRQKKYLDDAIVVITADHGESLGERGLLSHANGVHEPVLHVPLLISGLKARPSVPIKPFISLSDVAPTILAELGMPIPSTWTGVPIPALQAAQLNAGLVPFEMYDFAGVFDGRRANNRWKYWINRRTKEEFVYDLANDPLEQNNLLWKAPGALTAQWRRSVSPDVRR